MPPVAAANDYPLPINLGGLNSAAMPSSSYPDAVQATNVRWGLNGELQPRYGFAKFNTTESIDTGAPTLGLWEFFSRNGTSYVIARDRNRVYYVPSGSSVWTTLISGLTTPDADDVPDAVSFNGELIMVNGLDAPQVTDGVTGGALVQQGTVQTRTALTTAQSLSSGFHTPTEGVMVATCGATSVAAYDGITQVYDTMRDVWATRTRAPNNRDDAPGFCVDGMVYVDAGLSAAGTMNPNMVRYDHLTDSWKACPRSTARRQMTGSSANNGGFSQCGNADPTNPGWDTVNLFYDPVTNSWSVKTAFSTDPARRNAAGFALSENTHVVSGTITAADAYDAEHGSYNPFGDVWTDRTDITAARACAGGAAGWDNKGYIMGGLDSASAVSNVIYSYNFTTDAWATPSATLTTAKQKVGVGSDGWFMYAAGGDVGGTEQTSVDRYNVSPAAPIAKYVNAFGGYVLMAGSFTYPNRVWYSAAGNAREWDPDAFIDVKIEDGDFITGLFVFKNRFYIAKSDHLYLLSFSVLHPDPSIGDQSVSEETGTYGIVNNASIVVTDMGVYHMSPKGFALFDGNTTVTIADKVTESTQFSLGLRQTYACGIWNKYRNEIWWSAATPGINAGYVFVYNYKFNKWSLFSTDRAVGRLVASETKLSASGSLVSPKILMAYSAADASGDVFIYTWEGLGAPATDSGDAMPTPTWQSGWIQPNNGTREFSPKDLFLWTARNGGGAGANVNITVKTRTNYATTDRSSDTLVMSTKNTMFQDTTDRRGRIELGGDSAGHALSIVLEWASGSTGPGNPTSTLGVDKIILLLHQTPAGGSYPVTGA